MERRSAAAAADPSWAGRKARVGVRREEPRPMMGSSLLVKAALEEGGGGVPAEERARGESMKGFAAVPGAGERQALGEELRGSYQR